MSKSLTKIYVHIVFSTKNRKPYLSCIKLRERLYQYIAKICEHHKCPIFVINATADHIHLLLTLSRTMTLSSIVEEIKASTSKWIKSTESDLREFYWQAGYGAFSVNQSGLDAVIRYINNQEIHHKKISFEEELTNFLKAYHIHYDEKKLWA